MSEEILHTPYDLGLGVTLGDKREVDVGGTCHIQYHEYRAVLIWEVRNAPHPFLLICFEDVETLRILDETWISTETDSKRWKGIDGSFARTVKGGEYPTPITLMNEIAGPIVHYQFVTGSDCVDVLARDEPKAKFVARQSLASFNLKGWSA